MKGITDWAFRNKAAMKIGVVMAMLVGVLSYLTLPMEFLPSADNPAVTITAVGQGYDAKTMESSVTEPLEKALSLIKGKSSMISSTGNGFTKIDLTFDSKTKMKEAKAEVQEAVNSVRLPMNVSPPYVVQYNTSMIPVSWLSITFKDGLTSDNVNLAEERIVPEFQKIKGVGSVSFYGKTTPSVSITADPVKLAQHNVPYQALLGVLHGRDYSTSIGEKTISGTPGNLKVTGQVRDLDTLNKLQIAPGVTLGDVAEVKNNTSQESVSRVGGKDTLMITVTKASGANTVDVGNGVQEVSERLKTEYPNAEVSVLSSTSDMVVDSVNSMLQEVLLGALFATLVILLFLRNLRTTFITIVSIPLSLAITLYLLKLSGVTLNVITLGGVAVAVGRLVDDSIVVIENIYRRLQKEPFSIKLITDATGEVASAITASTITTVAVFLPMGLLSGSLQAFLLPFALTVAYSLLTSLVVALTVVPLLSAVLLKNTKLVEHEPSRRFTNFLDWNLKNKWLPLLISGLLFAGSIGMYVSMPKGAIDSSDAASLTVTLDYPSQTLPEKVLEEGKKLEKFLNEQTGPKWVMMQYGNSAEAVQEGAVVSPTQVSFMIEMKKGTDSELLINSIKGQRSNYPGAELNAGALDYTTNASSTQIFVDVTGEDPVKLNDAATLVMEQIRTVDGVLKVSSNQEQKKSVYAFEVDSALANTQNIAQQLQGMLSPVPIGIMQLNNKQASVFLNPIVNPTTMQDLSGLTVQTASGPVPISTVAKITKTDEATVLYHKEGKGFVQLPQQ